RPPLRAQLAHSLPLYGGRSFRGSGPAGYIDGMLLYASVSGNPLLLIDPLGLFSIEEVQRGRMRSE
ncbi:MAG: hypothetical protein L0Y42_15660, partial [Phycisphaerales bacterium]|nr:hypothetical protein [Phycisphaerales bacterium]